ncbi:MAG: hypothetical protein PHP26_07655 [Syntrophomonas sp.]|uniref:hypothetical protein n=1 Tax=Syntrophomonas sp. TaxID=2053627 RepID=UPI00262CEC5F|nr:hypothetical protein [Syntrophomonas sp.]MDD2510455.1 hypothetical protein [Syntrophomonas sp.]MDD3879848.1 hypothetical protein [Syntrophomonas sp.]MDD4626711.1 hypothetical protein [Syntrophomonas sp.]
MAVIGAELFLLILSDKRKAQEKMAKIAFSQQILYKEKADTRPQITKFTNISCL